MTIIEIKPLNNGAHRNQTSNRLDIPEGWAVIPPDMELKNFPFGDLTVDEINGIMTVTNWTPGIIPDPEPDPEPEPTEVKQLRAQVADLQNQILTMRLGG